MAEMAECIARVSTSGVPMIRSSRVQDLPDYNGPIGLSGYAGCGKTEAAGFIEQAYGYKRQHIAEPLRRMLASLLRDYGYSERNIERWLVGEWKDGILIPELGVTSRHLQITLGTEWGRVQVGSDIWAKLWRIQAEVGRAFDGKGRLNDSVRFPNEEASVQQAKGFTILITRPGKGPAAFKWRRVGPLLYRWFGCMWGVHDSERVDRLHPDYVVVNDGTIDELHAKIAQVVRKAKAGLASASLRG
ncbi:hypothetical protein [Sphingomonas hankookensis]|uniref:hypothetical protein n=1 Tax=Sphingomonas hankookensis TaxID=563996 RepID=UPI003D3027D5